jgi:hypothetical protein
MKIEKIPTKQLIADYKRLSELEEEYFTLCKKYDRDGIYEPDPALLAIQLELGRRSVYLSRVEK